MQRLPGVNHLSTDAIEVAQSRPRQPQAARHLTPELCTLAILEGDLGNDQPFRSSVQCEFRMSAAMAQVATDRQSSFSDTLAQRGWQMSVCDHQCQTRQSPRVPDPPPYQVPPPRGTKGCCQAQGFDLSNLAMQDTQWAAADVQGEAHRHGLCLLPNFHFH